MRDDDTSSIHRPKHTQLVRGDGTSMHKSPVKEPPLPDLFTKRCVSNQCHFLFADEPFTADVLYVGSMLLKD